MRGARQKTCNRRRRGAHSYQRQTRAVRWRRSKMLPTRVFEKFFTTSRAPSRIARSLARSLNSSGEFVWPMIGMSSQQYCRRTLSRRARDSDNQNRWRRILAQAAASDASERRSRLRSHDCRRAAVAQRPSIAQVHSDVSRAHIRRDDGARRAASRTFPSHQGRAQEDSSEPRKAQRPQPTFAAARKGGRRSRATTNKRALLQCIDEHGDVRCLIVELRSIMFTPIAAYKPDEDSRQSNYTIDAIGLLASVVPDEVSARVL